MTRKRPRLVPLALLMVLCLLLAPTGANALPWKVVHPSPVPSDLFQVAYQNGQFVAVGTGGGIYTSADGAAWAPAETDGIGKLAGVAYGNGLYVAAGVLSQGDGAVVQLSGDGRKWQRIATPGRSLTHIAFGNGRFVALGKVALSPLQVLTSANGYDWQTATLPDYTPTQERVTYSSLTFGNGRFAVMVDGQAYSSADGLTWEKGPLLPQRSKFDWYRLHTAGGYLYAFSSNAVYRSEDGVRWDMLADQGVAAVSLTHDGKRLVALNDRGHMYTSPDGAVWSETGFKDLFRPRALAYGAGTFVVVGEQGQISSSPDAATWTLRTPGSRFSLSAMTYGEGLYVAVGGMPGGRPGQDGLVLTSPDGVSWTSRLQGKEERMIGVAYGAGRFVAAGDFGLIYSSADGVTWDEQKLTTPPGTFLRPFATLFEQGRFVIFTEEKTFVSADGLTWTERPLAAPPGRYRQVIYAAGRYVLVGFTDGWDAEGRALPVKPLIAVSTDAERWENVSPDARGELEAVAYGAGRFVAAGPFNVWSSTDGRTWSQVDIRYWSSGFDSIAYGDERFVATRTLLGAAESADGVTWPYKMPSPAAEVPGKLFYVNGHFFALGRNGMIMLKSGPPPCPAKVLDVPAADPACPAVTELLARRVVTGRPDSTFGPGDALTRAEFATMLVRAKGWAPAPGGPLPFGDVAGHWAAGMGTLQAAVEHGVFTGYEDGTLRPDAPVTRAELVKMAAAAQGLKPLRGSPYYDAASGEWYSGWAAAAYEARLIGFGARHPVFDAYKLRAEEPATRAEAAMLLANVVGP